MFTEFIEFLAIFATIGIFVLIIFSVFLFILLTVFKRIRSKTKDYQDDFRNTHSSEKSERESNDQIPGFDPDIFKVDRNERELYSYITRLGIENKILTNLYIPTRDGRTTEIDMVVITKVGFFVIEFKNNSGDIYGDEDDKDWYVDFSSISHPFYNPIWQNNGHINALRKLYGFENLPYFSYVVFSNYASLIRIDYYSEDVTVLQTREVNEAITNDYNRSVKSFSPKDINTYYDTLSVYTNADLETRINHCRSIINKYKS